MRTTLYETGRELVQNSPDLLCDVDVEADGVAGNGSVLSIGAVSPWGDKFYSELRPQTPELYVAGHREFCNSHGLEHARLMDEGKPPRQALEEFADWAQTIAHTHEISPGAVLASFNASYDFPLLDLAYRTAGVASPFGHSALCVKSLAMVLPHTSEVYDWQATRKSRLPPDIKPAQVFTHNALDDAIYQQQIHFAIVGLLHTRHQTTTR